MVACLCAYNNLQPNCFACGTLEWKQCARPIRHDNLAMDQQAIMSRVCFGLTSCATTPWTWIWKIESRHNLDLCCRRHKLTELESTTDWSLTPAKTRAADEMPSIALNFDAYMPSRLILIVGPSNSPGGVITPTWRARYRCFNPANLPRGVPEVVDCAVRIVIERPRTRRYAQGHWTQDLYRLGLPRWRTLRPVWGSSMTPCAWCWVEIWCLARYPTLLYIVQGAGS
jgi:hypothetical protein